MASFENKYINIESISSLTGEEGIKKKLEIINSHNLIDIPSALLPEVFTSDYFFVSYSHLDYKEVYSDIFYLQLHGLNIWYDRGIPAGTNWKDVASRYLTPFTCKGVIFYISENSLLSNAVINELEYALEANKQIIAINLPFTSDYKWNNRSVKGKIYSVSEMIKILEANNKFIGKEKIEKLETIFPQDLIYLPFSMNIITKVEKIKSNIVKKSLLRGHFDEKSKMIFVDSTNDTSITRIRKDDIFDLMNDLKVESTKEYKISFSSCCFANCLYLETVEIPKNISIDAVGDSSFFGDVMFKGFLGNNIIHNIIGKEAFKNCSNLKTISISKHISELGSMAFMNCGKLSNIDNCYYKHFMGMDTLRYKDCPDLVIKENTFANCTSLEHVDIFPGTIGINDYAFLNCFSLKSLKMERRVKTIREHAFEGCDNLTSFGVDSKNPYLLEENNLLFSTENGSKNGIILITDKDKLKRVKLSQGIKTISDEVLKNVREDIEFIVDERNIYFSSYKGSLYNKNYTFLISFFNEEKKNSLVPEDFHPNTRTIGSYAFVNSSFYSFKSPENLETIKDDAFINCKNAHFFFFSMNVVNFGSGLFPIKNHLVIFTAQPEDSKSIRSLSKCGRPIVYNFNENSTEIFSENETLYQIINNKEAKLIANIGEPEKIIIPDTIKYHGKDYSVTKIGKHSFEDHSNLSEVLFGSNVNLVESYAFSNCTSLSKVKFNNGLRRINTCAFNECKRLKQVYLPPTIEEIEAGGFNNCSFEKFVDPTKRINLKKILYEYYLYD